MAVFYEWDVEIVERNGEDLDVIEHLHQRNYQGTIDERTNRLDGPKHSYRTVLVRDDDAGRSWAYMEGKKLPEYFIDSGGADTHKVPDRFHKEVAKAYS